MYLTQRFFWIFGTIAALFALSYALPFLFVWVQYLLATAFFLALIDLGLTWWAAFRRSVQVTRTVNPTLSLSDENPVLLHIKSSFFLPIRLEVIDEMPVELQRRDFSAFLALSPDEETTISYTIQPLERGEWLFEYVQVFISTILGLVQWRIRAGEPEKVAVFPSVLQMKKYELQAFRPTATQHGIKRIRRLGHSYEFEQIRNYVEGDDFRSINWKATGRKDSLMVNQYVDERSQQAYQILDKSRVMRMPFKGLSLLDYSINSALALSNIIIKKGDKAGLISFSDVLGSTVQAGRGGPQMRILLNALYKEEARTSESNYELLYMAIRKLIPSRSLIVLYSNFESSYALDRALPHLRRIAQFHLLVVVFFVNTELEAVASEPATDAISLYRQTVAENFIQEKKEMVRRLRQFGIHAVLTRPEDLSVNTINKYLELKARGMT